MSERSDSKGDQVCPVCSNLLVVSKSETDGYNRSECKACPYARRLKKVYSENFKFTPKEPEDIIGGEKAWDNVDKTQAQCPEDNCDSGMAYFRQVQTRSADEPMTSFYRCVKCHRQWQD